MKKEKLSVLFVCLGNICRSPTAEAIFSQDVADASLSEVISVDSCGTGDWHIGHSPDPRACAAGSDRGYSLESLRARQLCSEDFYRYDYIMAMDNDNLQALEAARPEDSDAVVALLLEQTGNEKESEVPDPYYGGSRGFDYVISLIETASQQLLRQLKERLATVSRSA